MCDLTKCEMHCFERSVTHGVLVIASPTQFGITFVSANMFIVLFGQADIRPF